MNAHRYIGWVALAGLCLAVFLIFCAPGTEAALAPSTDVSGAIVADTLWSLAGSPYVVTGDVTVEPEATLTLEPGVEVRFDGNYALTVRGALYADGTPSEPIRFTSNQPSPAPGDWAMIDVRAESRFAYLRHTIVEYGGNSGRAGARCIAGALCAKTSAFDLVDSTMQHNATRGLVLVQSDAVVNNNTFDDHSEEAVRLHGCDTRIGPCRPTITGNTFTHNAVPIFRNSEQEPYLSGNVAGDNETNGVEVTTCSFTGDVTWYADLPYVVRGWCDLGGYGPVRLTLEPGTVVKFDGGGMTVNYSAVLSATGTAGAPITFTSFKDDAAGGDTNNDGADSLPAPNDYHHVRSSGVDARMHFAHAQFRYGGASGIVKGPLLWADYDFHVSIHQCEFSQSDVGVNIMRGAHTQIENSDFHDLQAMGVDAASGGQVRVATSRFEGIERGVRTNWGAFAAGEPLVEDNRFEGGEVGVYVQGGNPTVRNNRFEGNETAVHIVCNPGVGPCAPVVSPDNRFVGAGQQGIVSEHPQTLCVEAGRNWWGSESGPDDPSAQADACQYVDNPGTGAYSSDGVEYSPWQGGVARPFIAQPACGTTAQTRPTFVGRSDAGATVTLYDGGEPLGQTTVGEDDAFAWTPTEPLSDGLHIFTAQATLGEELSLPSLELPLTVDSTLPFDPLGVRITYQYHDSRLTQYMRDADGCASPYGSLDTPIWVRPGSIMTLTVPFRTSFISETVASVPDPAPQGKAPVTAPEVSLASPTTGEMVDITFTVPKSYSTTHRVDYVRWSVTDADGNVTPYSKSVKLPATLIPGTQVTVKLPVGGQFAVNYLLETKPDTPVARIDHAHPQIPTAISIVPEDPIQVQMWNRTGRQVVRSHAVDEAYWRDRQTPGGSLTDPQQPLGPDEFDTVTLPRPGLDCYWMVLEDAEGTLYSRWIDMKAGPPYEVVLHAQESGSDMILTNNTEDEIAGIYLHRHLKDKVPEKNNARLGLNLWEYYRLRYQDLFPDGVLKPGDFVAFRLEGTDEKDPALPEVTEWRYSVFAVNEEGKVVSTIKNLWHGARTERKFEKECEPPAKARKVPASSGTEVHEAVLQRKLPRTARTPDLNPELVEYYANLPQFPGELSLVVCVYEGDEQEGGSEEVEVPLGVELVDPDGYVYDAVVGLEALIEGATVTCDQYDEDLLSWSRWPAELYESQINPQVTGEDGYYAFFVPSGLYRVRAEAEGYEPHTSPDIRVIREIVHYNVAMDPLTGYPVYLPLAMRAYTP